MSELSINNNITVKDHEIIDDIELLEDKVVTKIVDALFTTVIPDFSQDDPNAPDYIKNKPTKTSDFKNDGATGESTYVEYKDLNNVNKVDDVQVSETGLYKSVVENKIAKIDLSKFVKKELRTGSTTEYKVLSDNNLSDDDKNKLNKISLLGDGTKVLTDKGTYEDNYNILKVNGVTPNTNKEITIAPKNISYGSETLQDELELSVKYKSKDDKTIVLDNNKAIVGKDTKGAETNIAKVDDNNVIQFGDTTKDININTDKRITVNSTEDLAYLSDIDNEILLHNTSKESHKDLRETVTTIQSREILQLTNTEMKNYALVGGLTNGQLVVPKDTSTYTAGKIYKFTITETTQQTTYSFSLMSNWQVENTYKNGQPTTTTAGVVGQQYWDIINKKIYRLRTIVGEEYTWEDITPGSSVSSEDLQNVIQNKTLISDEYGGFTAGNNYKLLNGDGLIPVERIPQEVLNGLVYGGSFNSEGIITASTAVPELQGQNISKISIPFYRSKYFLCKGNYTLAGEEYISGNFAMSSGAEWVKIANSGQVISVNGKDGVVVINAAEVGAISIEQADKDVMNSLSIRYEGDNTYLDKKFINIKTANETSLSEQVQLASDSQAGLMSMADYAQIRDNTSRIEALEGKTTRLLYTAKTDPTAEDINTFVTGLGYKAPFEGIAVVVDETYHIWHYYENSSSWKDDGVDTVTQFTNTSLGTIKGAEVDGKIYAETDGTGSVYGWASLKSSVSNEISNRENADKTLQTNIDKISSDLSDEVTNRTVADNNLQTNIDAKVPKTDYKAVSEINPDNYSGGDTVNVSYKKSYYISDGTYYTDAGNGTPLFSVNKEHLKLSKNSNNQLTYPLLNINTDNIALKTDINALKTNIDNEIINRTSADTNLQSKINEETSTRASEDTKLQTSINTINSDLSSEISNRESAESILQTNIDSESSTREANDKTLQSNLTAHEQNTSNPHKVTKSQVGLSEVDNTSDKDKPISTATQSALYLKLDKENANLSMAKDIGVSTEGDNVYLDVSYKNLSTKVESENKKQIKLASDSEAGLMSIADYSQIRKNTEDIGQLKDQNIRLLYATSENPTSEDIKNFVTNEGYTDITKWISIAVVVKTTNHIWRYYDNTQVWQDIGVDTVNLWTNEIAGIVKGSNVDGKVYAETDGTASVNGWADLKSSVSNEISNRESADKELQTNINNETSARQSADNTLQSNINTLDGQVVKLDTDQTVDGIKTFSNYIKTPQVASVEGKGLVRYKETEGKSVYGNDSTGNVLMGNTDRPSYSKSGSDFTGTDLALYSDVTTETSARTSADTTLQSNIDSEASTREASDTNLQTQISTNATNIANKVDKVTGKGLSTNDFTTAYKNQIDTNTSNIANKLEASNIKAGTNITVSTSGNDVTISAVAEGASVVNIGGERAPIVNFDSDPQTQLSAKINSNQIVQATGDSSSNIMSQKAVTDALTQNKDNLDSEIYNRQTADSTLQTNIDDEASKRITTDTNLQTQITNNDTDISNLQSTKLDSSKADKNVVNGVTISANDDNVNVVRAYVNLSTQTTSSDAETFPLANDTTAGLMSKADYSQIRDNKARIEQLEGQNVRLTYTTSTSPTASQIEAFVKAEGYTDTSKWIYIGVVVSGTNHIWRYYTNTATWTDIGVDTVNQFTNSIAGIIKGSATAGKVYAETDGTGSVYGWDNLNTSVSNNTSAISTETTNRVSADTALSNRINNDATPHTTTSITLTVAGWSNKTQTVTITGYDDSKLNTVVPDLASAVIWANCGINASAENSNGITFTCAIVPTVALTFKVISETIISTSNGGSSSGIDTGTSSI